MFLQKPFAQGSRRGRVLRQVLLPLVTRRPLLAVPTPGSAPCGCPLEPGSIWLDRHSRSRSTRWNPQTGEFRHRIRASSRVADPLHRRGPRYRVVILSMTHLVKPSLWFSVVAHQTPVFPPPLDLAVHSHGLHEREVRNEFSKPSSERVAGEATGHSRIRRRGMHLAPRCPSLIDRQVHTVGRTEALGKDSDLLWIHRDPSCRARIRTNSPLTSRKPRVHLNAVPGDRSSSELDGCREFASVDHPVQGRLVEPGKLLNLRAAKDSLDHSDLPWCQSRSTGIDEWLQPAGPKVITKDPAPIFALICSVFLQERLSRGWGSCPFRRAWRGYRGGRVQLGGCPPGGIGQLAYVSSRTSSCFANPRRSLACQIVRTAS